MMGSRMIGEGRRQVRARMGTRVAMRETCEQPMVFLLLPMRSLRLRACYGYVCSHAAARFTHTIGFFLDLSGCWYP